LGQARGKIREWELSQKKNLGSNNTKEVKREEISSRRRKKTRLRGGGKRKQGQKLKRKGGRAGEPLGEKNCTKREKGPGSLRLKKLRRSSTHLGPGAEVRKPAWQETNAETEPEKKKPMNSEDPHKGGGKGDCVRVRRVKSFTKKKEEGLKGSGKPFNAWETKKKGGEETCARKGGEGKSQRKKKKFGGTPKKNDVRVGTGEEEGKTLKKESSPRNGELI